MIYTEKIMEIISSDKVIGVWLRTKRFERSI